MDMEKKDVSELMSSIKKCLNENDEKGAEDHIVKFVEELNNKLFLCRKRLRKFGQERLEFQAHAAKKYYEDQDFTEYPDEREE